MTRETGLTIVDEQHYQTLALNLSRGYGFAWEPGKLTSLRPPLYPAFVAFVWTLTGTESVLYVRGLQIFLSLMNVFLLYRLGELLFDRRVALLAAAVMCFYPSLVAFNFFVLTEVFFTFLLTLMALGYVTLLRTQKVWVAWSTGGVLGLAALTRSVLWPFPVVLCPLVFFTVPGSRRWRLWMSAALFLGYALVVAPWAVRNTKLQRVFTVIDTMGGITFRMGNYEYTDLNRAWDPATLRGEKSIFQGLQFERPEVRLLTEGQKEKLALKKTLTYMLEHPGLTLKRAAIKFASFWGLERTVIAGWRYGLQQPPRWFAVLGTFFIPFAYVVVILLACLGVFLSPPVDRRVHLFFLLLLGFITGIHTMTFGHERYHLPLIPFLSLYAAAAILRKSWLRFREGVQAISAPLMVGAGLLVIWGREVLIVDTDRIQSLFHFLFG
jgi:4-amino-4-deoxy-L-arabinose transferase-like glycosyltransferase